MSLITEVSFRRKMYREILASLRPPDMRVEEVVFAFAKLSKKRGTIRLQCVDWRFMRPEEYVIQSEAHVELVDDIRPTLIQKAQALDSCVVEMHSHLHGLPCFSPSDMSGFKEFVPHVRWRLARKPYAALVIADSGIDGLIWWGNDNTASQLDKVMIQGPFGRKAIKPSGITMAKGMRHGKFGTL